MARQAFFLHFPPSFLHQLSTHVYLFGSYSLLPPIGNTFLIAHYCTTFAALQCPTCLYLLLLQRTSLSFIAQINELQLFICVASSQCIRFQIWLVFFHILYIVYLFFGHIAYSHVSILIHYIIINSYPNPLQVSRGIDSEVKCS
jgi:hypothetical protein